MATKRFDEANERARALEAQAKKLRREARAAKTKAYADALAEVFPEVEDMGSADEVLAFVRSLRRDAGHGDAYGRPADGGVPVPHAGADAGESSQAYRVPDGSAFPG